MLSKREALALIGGTAAAATLMSSGAVNAAQLFGFDDRFARHLPRKGKGRGL